jgi:hypothetical protein
MAHFAEINSDNIVIRVLVTDDAMPNEGLDWLVKNLGGTWIQTSYNTHLGEHSLGETPLRKNYAGVGYTYNQEIDAFVFPKPYESWLLNAETGSWIPPIAHPEAEGNFSWDESALNWVQHGLPEEA